MIFNQWYAILESSEVKKGKLLGVIRFGEKLLFWRTHEGEIACIKDRCAHRGAALSKGKLVSNSQEVQCPFHGLHFDRTGKCTIIPSRGEKAFIPSNFKVESYYIREAHNFIWIWWGIPQDRYPDIPWFDDVDDKFHYYTLKDPWKTHYSRCIENQLDVSHLWIVHHNTIGRGNKKVSDGPYVDFSDNLEKVWVTNRKENGNVSILPSEIEKPPHPSLVQFKFPNMWQNKFSDVARIIIAFAPVDEENTILYLRFIHKMTRIPILRGIISIVGRYFSKIIAHQDRRVVETQLPKITAYKMEDGDNLFPADYPIVIYRRIRDEMKKRKI
ncbi:MAG: aromatic ring-hydroxylating dioxygenase subunit alpha [Candidatus Lokiarchaeota archaeon]|nr:aromatic ring-hydroxylating dioxygenase subunit alpha [Candidatus Lokiarchaeota archaeon]